MSGLPKGLGERRLGEGGGGGEKRKEGQAFLPFVLSLSRFSLTPLPQKRFKKRLILRLFEAWLTKSPKCFTFELNS